MRKNSAPHSINGEIFKGALGMIKDNQKSKYDVSGGIVYVFRALNTDLDLYKIGKSESVKNRFKNYNSSNANDIKLLFIVKVNDAKSVEKCVKEALKRYNYRKYKEIYEVDIDVIKMVMTTCDQFVDGMKKAIEDKIQKKNLKDLKNKKNKLFITFDKK